MFLCSACSVHFDENTQRREHMREEWHVYNVKRRVASLPPISSDMYHTVFARPAKSEPSSDSECLPSTNVANVANVRNVSEPSKRKDALPGPQECVFCLHASDSTLQSLDHMAASHGLVLPDLQNLQTDLDTLISYLHLMVADYCECLLCGVVKRSAHAARAHMLAKGHCMLNLSEGSEFFEFWEAEAGNGQEPDFGRSSYQLLSRTEMRLASGVVAVSRQDANVNTQQRPRRSHRHEELPKVIPSATRRSDDLVDGTVGRNLNHQDQRPDPRPSRALAVRDHMGLTGLSGAQKRSLAASQRKIDLSAFRARSKAQWTLENMGNKVKQKHFVVGSPCRSGWFLDPVMR